MATERLRDLVDSDDPPELPPLSEELVCTLDLPANLPAELTIAEVAEVAGVSAHTLRYYERIGLVEVGRDTAGHRRYDRDALARVVFMTRLRTSDMPIRTIRRYVELVKLGGNRAGAARPDAGPPRHDHATAPGPAGRAGRHRLPDHHLWRYLRALTRLGVDHVDLYYQHRPDPSVPIDPESGRRRLPPHPAPLRRRQPARQPRTRPADQCHRRPV